MTSTCTYILTVHRQNVEVKTPTVKNVEGQNAKWDKTSMEKNTEWDKTSLVTNVDWDIRLISKKSSLKKTSNIKNAEWDKTSNGKNANWKKC